MISDSNITLRRLIESPEDIAALQHIFEVAPDCFERAIGGPAEPGEAQSCFAAFPPGKTYADKFIFGVMLGDWMVGCVELIRGYPNSQMAMLGLLLIAESHQRSGFGKQAYQLTEDIILGWADCTRVRLGVFEVNNHVLPFWRKMGFTETGETVVQKQGRTQRNTLVLEKLF